MHIIEKNQKQQQVNTLECDLEAAYVYNEKAKELYGEYANLNKNLPLRYQEEKIENLVAKLTIS